MENKIDNLPHGKFDFNKNSAIGQFFFAENAVSGEPDYGLADTFVRTVEAFANATYQSVYIIDYFRKNFLYVSPNPLFLCGMSAEAVKELGYQFYLDHVPADEVGMLLEILPLSIRNSCTLLYANALIVQPSAIAY